MSIVGVMNSIQTLRLFNKALKYAVDHLKNLKIIYAFTTNSDDEETKKLFSYAKKKEIQICIPDNMLKRRNTNKQKKPIRNLRKKCKNTFLCSNFKIHKIKILSLSSDRIIYSR